MRSDFKLFPSTGRTYVESTVGIMVSEFFSAGASVTFTCEITGSMQQLQEDLPLSGLYKPAPQFIIMTFTSA